MKKIARFYGLALLIVACVSADAFAFKAKVSKITDGDTIHVYTMKGRRLKLRLVGIDTPEKYDSPKMSKDVRRCNVYKEDMRAFGQAASLRIKNYISRGDIIEVEVLGTGYYKRSLAYIYKDGVNINFKMVEDGYACVSKYSTSISRRDREILFNLQKQAMENKKGLWGVEESLMKCLCRVK